MRVAMSPWQRSWVAAAVHALTLPLVVIIAIIAGTWRTENQIQPVQQEVLHGFYSISFCDAMCIVLAVLQVTSVFLLPEMVERTASMLNYFLSYLTGQVGACGQQVMATPSHLLHCLCMRGLLLIMAALDSALSWPAAAAASSCRSAAASWPSRNLRSTTSSHGVYACSHARVLPCTKHTAANPAVPSLCSPSVLS